MDSRNAKRQPDATGVVLNTNAEAYKAAMLAREKAKRVETLEERVSRLEAIILNNLETKS